MKSPLRKCPVSTNKIDVPSALDNLFQEFYIYINHVFAIIDFRGHTIAANMVLHRGYEKGPFLYHSSRGENMSPRTFFAHIPQ
jgi:hypothetical protein